MPRHVRLSTLSIAILAWVSGYALFGLVAQPVGGFAAPAWAQRPAGEVDPSEWQRLAGPLPYRPENAGSGRLDEADVGRAVELIADQGVFFAKLSETDPNRRAGAIWAKSEAAYSAAAEDLRGDLADGRFRVVVAEGSSLAITRRGEEIWIDSDLAGDWDVARVRQARRNGDDWADLAGLSGLLFDLWRARGSTAAKVWLEQQRTTLDLPRDAQWQSGAGASRLTRYGVLKQLYLKASLLRAATADSLNAALWRDRAFRLAQQIEALLPEGPGTGPQDTLTSALRDDWAAYQTQLEQTASERTWLVLAPRRPAPERARTGDEPTQTAQVGDEADARVTDTSIEMIVPAGHADTGPAALKDRIDELEAARSRDRAYIAQLLARTAGAARAAEDAQAALATAQSASESEAAALATAQDRAAGYEAEAARLADKLAAAQSAAQSAADGAEKEKADLQRQLAAAQDRAANAESATTAAETVGNAAKDEVARLAADLATARSDSEAAAAAEHDLRQQREALAAELERARQTEADLQRQLSEAGDRASAAEADATRLAAAEDRAAGAEAEVARLGEELAKAQSAAQSAAENQENEKAELQRQLTKAQDRAANAESAVSAVATVRDAAEAEVARLAAGLATARSDSDGIAAERDRLRQEAVDLAAQQDRARQSEADLQARLAAAEERAAGAEAEVARLGEELTAAQSAAQSASEGATNDRADLQRQLAEAQARAESTATDLAAATAAAADLKQQLADREAEVARLESDADGRTTALSDAEAKAAELESRIETLQATATEAEAERAAQETALSELRAQLTAAQANADAEAERARAAEAAAAQADDRADETARTLAASQDEAARLREAQASVPAQDGEPASAPARGGPWADYWGIAVAIPLLFLVGLAGLLTVVWRRLTASHKAPAATESLPAAPADQPPTAVARRPEPPSRDEAPSRTETPSRRPAAEPPAGRPRPTSAVTSATIVEAVRRRDWATANSQFAELSGISAPPLRELLAEPSGEFLALACRAAELDRLTFVTLYLLQGEGRTAADPETVADAVSLFEHTGPAEARRRLAEQTARKSRDS